MRIYRVLLTVHDFFFYISREYGREASVEPVISNFALNYAINVITPQIHKFYGTLKPHYEEDMARIKLYCTPAVALKHPAVAILVNKVIPWHSENPVWISYNAVDSGNIFTMEHKKRKFVIPMFGRYQKYPPFNTFEFFILGDIGPKLIRIGKKLIPARLKYFECFDLTIEDGVFTPTHPVNFVEVKEKYEIVAGQILTIPPVPLLLNATLCGEHIRCKFKDEYGRTKHVYIALPSEKMYPEVYKNGLKW